MLVIIYGHLYSTLHFKYFLYCTAKHFGFIIIMVIFEMLINYIQIVKKFQP